MVHSWVNKLSNNRWEVGWLYPGGNKERGFNTRAAAYRFLWQWLRPARKLHRRKI